MKKIFLVLIALFYATASFSQGILNLFTKSDEFFQLMKEERFVDAQSYFDESVKAQIEPASLKLLWTRLSVGLGDFTSIDISQNKKQGELSIVVLEGIFTKGTQGFNLVFNEQEKLVGLFLTPKTNVVSYQKPLYADSALYNEKEIYVSSGNHKLVGLLTTPKTGTNFPVVVLVHGSGPADMDETIGATKPFKDLAAGLAAKGIATVRYVKRTMIYQGEFGGVFTVKEEVLDDALAAVNLTKTITEVDKKQIYLMGHSLGGMLAPKLATIVPDIKGLIFAAAPARKLTDLMVEQNRYFFERSGDTSKAGKEQLESVLQQIEKTRISKIGNLKADSLLLGIPAAYWVDLNQYDQVNTAKKLSQRMLFIQGGFDSQVSVQDFNIWKAGLVKNKNASFKLYPELNHLLTAQTEKGNVAQYQVPANVSKALIDDIAFWIKSK
ncbi:MAG: dienelactone hydrolase [Sphingobacteriales bacterium]|nr:dienelactone hydrolase [Sphingobacteriales bacterium]